MEPLRDTHEKRQKNTNQAEKIQAQVLLIGKSFTVEQQERR